MINDWYTFHILYVHNKMYKYNNNKHTYMYVIYSACIDHLICQHCANTL